MAGTHPQFDKAKVVAGLTLAQTMGAAVDVADQPLFHFAEQIDYEVADSAGAPWRYTGNPEADVTPGPAPVRAVVGRKMLTSAPAETPVGQVTALSYRLTILPDVWEQIADFTYVVMDGDIVFRRIGPRIPQSALFDLPIRKVIVATGKAVGGDA